MIVWDTAPHTINGVLSALQQIAAMRGSEDTKMAQQDTNVTSLGFRTRTHGVVTHQQTTKFNAEKANELIVALEARVAALEAFQTSVQSSNSPGI